MKQERADRAKKNAELVAQQKVHSAQDQPHLALPTKRAGPPDLEAFCLKCSPLKRLFTLHGWTRWCSSMSSNTQHAGIPWAFHGQCMDIAWTAAPPGSLCTPNLPLPRAAKQRPIFICLLACLMCVLHACVRSFLCLFLLAGALLYCAIHKICIKLSV